MTKTIDQPLEQFRSLRDTQLPEFNRQVREKGIDAILLKEEKLKSYNASKFGGSSVSDPRTPELRTLKPYIPIRIPPASIRRKLQIGSRQGD